MLIYTLPIIAAFTGWMTNFLAIKMLFHPRKPINILGFKVQGIFPKRKEKLAEKLGDIVSNELFSIEDIKKRLGTAETTEGAFQIIEERIDLFLTQKLPQSMPMIAMFLNEKTRGKIKEVLQYEFNDAMPEIIDNYTQQIEQAVDVRQIVYEKVVNFSSDKLEEILYSIMKREFRFIEILGGILGFIIGLMQIGILQLQG